MTSAYQRRLREIEFWKQRGQELEAIIEAMVRNGAKMPFLPAGITSDAYITDISSGDFAMRMMGIQGVKKT